MLSASASQRCPSYQRRPNKPVNAMLGIGTIRNFLSLIKLSNSRKIIIIEPHGTYRQPLAASKTDTTAIHDL